MFLEFPFASKLNSEARQVSAERAWSAIARFYLKCRENAPTKNEADTSWRSQVPPMF
jgi:hypothetical protein